MLHQKVLFFSCIIFFYKKLKNYSIQSYKDCLLFVFSLFCFLLLSNNTLHLMFYTYIRYWNTLQYKYIIQITFHVGKISHARVFKIFVSAIVLFLCLFLFCVIEKFYCVIRMRVRSYSGPYSPHSEWIRTRITAFSNWQSEQNV